MAQLIAVPDAQPQVAEGIWYELPGDKVAASMDVDPAKGLTSGEAAARLEEYRSEEHTSELQSQSNLVCRLLLEKKKTGEKAHIMILALIRRLPPALVYDHTILQSYCLQLSQILQFVSLHPLPRLTCLIISYAST